MVTPYSVKQNGACLSPILSELEVTICDLQQLTVFNMHDMTMTHMRSSLPGFNEHIKDAPWMDGHIYMAGYVRSGSSRIPLARTHEKIANYIDDALARSN